MFRKEKECLLCRSVSALLSVRLGASAIRGRKELGLQVETLEVLDPYLLLRQYSVDNRGLKVEDKSRTSPVALVGYTTLPGDP